MQKFIYPDHMEKNKLITQKFKYLDHLKKTKFYKVNPDHSWKTKLYKVNHSHKNWNILITWKITKLYKVNHTEIEISWSPGKKTNCTQFIKQKLKYIDHKLYKANHNLHSKLYWQTVYFMSLLINIITTNKVNHAVIYK